MQIAIVSRKQRAMTPDGWKKPAREEIFFLLKMIKLKQRCQDNDLNSYEKTQSGKILDTGIDKGNENQGGGQSFTSFQHGSVYLRIASLAFDSRAKPGISVFS